ncbi:MAG: glycoside hydrolase family 127 protein [Clostridia bacterium]|nr:glycoside hydrolase family 127 protein [Clostridia bacterium]
MANVDFSLVELKEGFWKDRQTITRNVSLPAIKAEYVKKKRFDATKCGYKSWQFWRKPPHIFYDSDVAKYVEAWAYLLQKERDENAEKFIDGLIDNIAKNQRADGYYNAHFLVTRKNSVFKHRTDHELYCLGHLIEAAIAYANATGKDKLIGVVERYCDYVEKRFIIDKDTAFTCPGHPEIELALVKLYKHTGKRKYLEMAKYFIYVRGTDEGDKGLNKSLNRLNPWLDGYYGQDFLPLKEQRTAEGHSVRACYLYAGATDVARIEKDDELLYAMECIYENIVDRRMYVTGGIGAKALTEAFDKDFILPNDKAYTESCAAISLILFARRLQESKRKVCYADLIERVLYNGFLSGISLSGDKFFYENPLEIDFAKRKLSVARYPVATRQKDFSCSCCPPNIARTIASVGSYVYATDGKDIYVDQFIASSGTFNVGEKQVKITLDTQFPQNGSLNLSLSGGKGTCLKVRKPEWAEAVTATKTYVESSGYLAFEVDEDGYEASVEFSVEPKVIGADERVETNKGTCYVKYGPLIYCAEAVDNGNITDYTLSTESKIEKVWSDEYNAYCLNVSAENQGERAMLKMIPYFAFANRGESDMYVYINKK